MTRARRGDKHADIGSDRIVTIRGADQHLESPGISGSARYHASGRVKREPWRKAARCEAHSPDRVRDPVNVIKGGPNFAVVQGLCGELEIRVAWQNKNGQNSGRIVALPCVIS